MNAMLNVERPESGAILAVRSHKHAGPDGRPMDLRVWAGDRSAWESQPRGAGWCVTCSDTGLVVATRIET